MEKGSCTGLCRASHMGWTPYMDPMRGLHAMCMYALLQYAGWALGLTWLVYFVVYPLCLHVLSIRFLRGNL